MVARAVPRREFISVEEYFEFDEKAEWKYEYFNGMVWPVGEPDRLLSRAEILEFLAGKRLEAMAGGSSKHAIIGGNIFGALFQRLKGKGCRPFNNDLKVRLSPTGMFCYPDVTVACAPIEIDDQEMLLNPTLIVEVLSPSTTNYDRGDKWAHYQRLESLQEYVLVSQDKQKIEVFTRQEGGAWLLRTVSEEEIELASIACRLEVSAVYDGVEFDGNALSQAPF